MSINQATLVGRVGQDCVIRHNTAGEMIATFSLATSETWKDKNTGERKEQTEWHNIVVFNQALAKVAEGYVKKGSLIGIHGQIKTRKYTDKDGIERKVTDIVVGRFKGDLFLLGSPPGARANEGDYGTTRTRETDPPPADEPKQSFARDLDDEVPF